MSSLGHSFMEEWSGVGVSGAPYSSRRRKLLWDTGRTRSTVGDNPHSSRCVKSGEQGLEVISESKKAVGSGGFISRQGGRISLAKGMQGKGEWMLSPASASSHTNIKQPSPGGNQSDQGLALPCQWGDRGVRVFICIPLQSPSQQPLIWFDVSFNLFLARKPFILRRQFPAQLPVTGSGSVTEGGSRAGRKRGIILLSELF